MKDRFLKVVKDFLQGHLRSDGPLLLGYSGGPDSKALLYLLLECRAYFNFELHIAHIDHGWRPESEQEARSIEEEIKGLGLSFHLKRLSLDQFKEGNLEEQARTFRLNFFFELHAQHRYQALLLGHQADDQAEVVLKRVCEGAHVSKLSGLSENRLFKGLALWRPLLSVRKKALILWLKERHLSYFVDPTNESARFLRGRMRTSIVPGLAHGFGKDVVENLCFLGETAGELEGYFRRKTSIYLSKIIREERGSSLDFPAGLEKIELQFLIKEWFAQENITLSRGVLAGILDKWMAGEEAKFPARGAEICVERNRLFVLYRK